jgi:hypothetical protein
MKLPSLELELKSALLGTGLVQPVESVIRGGGRRAEIEVLSRQTPGSEAVWLRVVDRMLAVQETLPVSIHVCRRYVRKNGKLVFGWNIGVSGSMAEIEASVRAILPLLLEVRPELEVPIGATSVRTLLGQAPVADESEEASGSAQEPAPRTHSQPLAPGQHPPPREALPRPPGAAASGVTPPQGFTPTIRVVRNEVDEKGQIRIEEEMPLPHVYRQMNRPLFEGSTRGAFLSGDGGFHPAKTRRPR